MRPIHRHVFAASLFASAAAFLACSVGSVDGSSGDSPDAAPGAPAIGADSAAITSLAVLGAGFVEKRACASCHQASEASEGILSGQTTAKGGAYGSNLTPDPVTGIGTWSIDAIARAMTTNVDDQSRPLCKATPHFKDMNANEALAIATYLQGLTPVFRTIPRSQCGASPSGGTDAGDPQDASTPDDAATTPDADNDSGQLPDAAVDGAGSDAGSDANDAGCGYVGPTVVAPCHGCGTHVCQANGCYGGYWCKLAGNTCHPQPLTCP